MSLSPVSFKALLIVAFIILLVLPPPVTAFGAGNIPSIAQIEGKNWRHGDIEDMLKAVAFIKGHKWTSMMIKRVYFGNWLRDYSQAVDVGSLKGVSAPTIRILVWVLSFLSFGYATKEFEVTEERLGVYRPEEHIDNPKGYADNLDARTYDKRLRGPVEQVELEIDPRTGMKNYIANESGNWATSAGYVKYSFSRSIHFGRMYTNGAEGKKGNEADLCEALRCLGQGLHCMEDFGAHTNYCELALRELGFHDVFPHTGTATMMNLHGHNVFPLVTGTFGAVDFLHSVLGEATDHFTQSEVEEMDIALKTAEEKSAGGGASRGLFGFGSKNDGSAFINALSFVPGTSGLAQQARDLKSQSEAQEEANYRSRDGNSNQVPGMSESFDPVATCKKIYPILEFRDNVVRTINGIIAKVPGLEALVEKISETLTVFVLSLLAPIIRPIIDAVSASLKAGSSTVVDASQKQQFEPWNVPTSTDPTHSMLSKDHFTNYLNSVAGRVAATILQYVAPRVIYAWQNPGVPVEEVMTDILHVFHHPAIRSEKVEIQRDMFNTVRRWVDEQPDRNHINYILSSASVKAGGNQKSSDSQHAGHNHGAFSGSTADQIWQKIKTRDLEEMRGLDDRETGVSGGHLSPSPTSFGYQNGPYSAPEQPRPQSSGYASHLEPGHYQHNPGQAPLLNHGGSSPYQYGQPGWQQQGPSPPPQQYGGPPPQQYGQYPSPQYGGPPQQYGQSGVYGAPLQYPPPQQYGGLGGYPPQPPPQGQYPMPGPGQNPPYGQPGYPPQGPYNNQQYDGRGRYY